MISVDYHDLCVLFPTSSHQMTGKVISGLIKLSMLTVAPSLLPEFQIQGHLVTKPRQSKLATEI